MFIKCDNKIQLMLLFHHVIARAIFTEGVIFCEEES
jgi:hypothetical protein